MLGRADEGLGVLDGGHVAVAAGELSPVPCGIAYCAVIAYCHVVFDLGRCARNRHRPGPLVPQPAWTGGLQRPCQAHRAELGRLHGAWPEALEAAKAAQSLAARGDPRRCTARLSRKVHPTGNRHPGYGRSLRPAGRPERVRTPARPLPPCRGPRRGSEGTGRHQAGRHHGPRGPDGSGCPSWWKSGRRRRPRRDPQRRRRAPPSTGKTPSPWSGTLPGKTDGAVRRGRGDALGASNPCASVEAVAGIGRSLRGRAFQALAGRACRDLRDDAWRQCASRRPTERCWSWERHRRQPGRRR